MSNGKGSRRRPRAITCAEEADRWDATFGMREDCRYDTMTNGQTITVRVTHLPTGTYGIATGTKPIPTRALAHASLDSKLATVNKSNTD